MAELQSPEPFVLEEYGEREVALTGAQERALRHLAAGRLTILPADEPDRWVIKASSHVGTIVTAGVRILITPKVRTENLFVMLEAGGRAIDVRPEVFDYQQTRDLIPAFATFFARHVEAALSRGVSHDYRSQHERLSGIRGRVDVPAQLRMAGLPLPVECSFDEYTADTQLNRILHSAVRRLLRLPGVTANTRQALFQLTGRLEAAGPATAADLRTPTRFNRLNEHCRGAEHLARLVLASSGLQHVPGSSGAGVFLINMNKVFEEFVEQRLGRYLAGSLAVHGQAPTTLDTSESVRMYPDLVFSTIDSRVVYVGDSKYKLTADGFGRESDYYQLLAYATALDLPEGLLIYCQHDGSAPPREVVVKHATTRLRTWALRLDRSPADVEKELELLAVEISRRSNATTENMGKQREIALLGA